MKRLVYGLGRSGLGVLGYLRRHGMPARFYDDALKPEEAQKAQAMGFELEPDPKPGHYQEVIAAPGVPLNHPRLAALREGGAEVIGEAELVYRHSTTPLIGITGTAGKTSCTLFTAHFLRALGFRAKEGGNIDPPLSSVVDEAEVAVAELSSFQLERTRYFRPRVAVLLLLGVDHLDRHGTLEAYHGAKLRLIQNLTPQDALVYNAQDPRIREAVRGSPAQLHPFRPATNPRETNLNAALQAAVAYAQIVMREGPERPWPFPPTPENLRPFSQSAPWPEARYQVFARIGRVVFIDDSIATRLEAVRAALEAAPAPIAWVLGGVDKGAPVEELREVVGRKVGLILAIGRDGPRMAQAFQGLAEVVEVREADGRRALEQAVRKALERFTEGSVLLAPLAASFDQFKDYKERSRTFREVVYALGGQGG